MPPMLIDNQSGGNAHIPVYQPKEKNMRKFLLPALFLALAPLKGFAAPYPVCTHEDKSFFATPSIMLGVTFNFGGPSNGQNIGISAKILSNNWQDYQAAALGFTYFPSAEANKIGIDASLAYKTTAAVGTVGWDIVNARPQVSFGYLDAQEPKLEFCPVG